MWFLFGLVCAVIVFFMYYYIREVHTPLLSFARAEHCAAASYQRSVLDRCPSLHKRFYPTPWLLPAASQIIFLVIRRNLQKLFSSLRVQRELLSHDDGGVTALDWFRHDTRPLTHPKAVLLVCHSIMGFTEGLWHWGEDAYDRDWQAVVHVRRGHGGVKLKTPRWNTVGDSHDLRDALDHVQKCHPGVPVLLLGVSAGSGLTVRYLGEEGPFSPVVASAAVCPAFDLETMLDRVKWPWSSYLLMRLKQFFLLANRSVLGHMPGFHEALSTRGLYDFHTSLHPLTGFESKEDYFRRSNPIVTSDFSTVPTMWLNSADDPLCTRDNLQLHRFRGFHDERDAADHGVWPMALSVLVNRGGHMAFFEGMRPQFWMNKVVLEYLEANLSLHQAQPHLYRKAVRDTVQHLGRRHGKQCLSRVWSGRDYADSDCDQDAS